MKNLILAAVAVVSLGMGSAFAAGVPGSTDTQYGTLAFPNQPYHNGTVFSEIFHKVFGHQTYNNPAVASNATHGAASTTVR